MRLERMRPGEVKSAIGRGAVAMLPMGSLEVHGRHLPLGTDTLAPERIAALIEARFPEVLILPTLPYGCCESQTEFPGTVSLGPETLFSVLDRIFGGLYDAGMRKFVCLNGHGGNCGPLDRVSMKLSRRGACLAQLNWWRYVWDLNKKWTGGHAGGEETAAILSVDETLVDKSAYEPARAEGISGELPADGWDDVLFQGVRVPVPRPDIRVTDNGWLGPDPLETATKAWGDEMLSAAAAWAADFLAAFSGM